jgi:hypothetical protein
MADDLWDGAIAPPLLRVNRTSRAPLQDFNRSGGAMLRDRPDLAVARDAAALERARRQRAAAIRAAGGQTIEAYRPGVVQQGYDALQNGIAAVYQHALGADPRDAQRMASTATDNLKVIPEGLIGLSDMEQSVRNIAGGKGGAGDYVTAALMAAPELGRIPGVRSLAVRGVKGLGRLVGDRVSNAVSSAGRYAMAPSRRFSARDFDVVEDGPFLRVSRPGVEPQIVPAMRDAPSIADMRVIMADPVNNPALRMAHDLAVQRTGAPLSDTLPVSSFQRQSGIARAQRAAAEGSPEYKHLTFEAYGNQMPDVVEQAGAQNYDQLTEAAYRAFGDEAKQQFDRLPLRTSYHYGEGEYPTPSGMFRDVLGEGNLNVFRGGDRHPFLSNIDPGTSLTENEMFRANHDFIGHVARGATFRPGGEEIAYATHAQTMSPLAQMALLSETRGQNSLVNFSPLNVELLAKIGPIKNRIAELKQLDDMRGRPGASGREIADLNRQLRELGQETVFAPNVPGLLPPEYLDILTPGGIPDWLRPAIRPVAGTSPERAVHMSRIADLTATDPSFYGTGHRGREYANRGDRGSPAQKTSFYLGPQGTVRPEGVVADIAPHAYEAQLSNLYDIEQDPERLVALARALQPRVGSGQVASYTPDLMRMAREYGYSGIRTPNFLPGQAAAEVFDPVAGLRPVLRLGEGYARGGLAVRRAA